MFDSPSGPRRALCAAIAIGALSVVACDPCSGTSPCGAESPRLVMDGQLVRADDGRGVDGIRIDVVRTGGVTLGADSFSVTTTGGGFWRIESRADADGEAILTFRVHAPAFKNPYVVANRAVATVRRGGEAVVFERWVTTPYTPYHIELFYRGSDEAITLAPVELHRRGVTWLTGLAVHDSVAYSQTDLSAGRASLFPGTAFATDTGDVIGDLVVHLPEPLGVSVIRNFRLKPTYEYHASGAVVRYGAGPSLAYAVHLYDQQSGRMLADVPFELRRVSGIPVAPAVISGASDRDGYARFNLRALAVGDLVADLIVRPATGTQTFRVVLTTFDTDEGKVYADLRLGPPAKDRGLP